MLNGQVTWMDTDKPCGYGSQGQGQNFNYVISCC